RDLAWLLPRAVVDVDGLDFPYGVVLLIMALAVQRGFDPAPVLVTANPDSNFADVVRQATEAVWQLVQAKAQPADGASTPVTILANTPDPVRVGALVLEGSRQKVDVRASDGIYVRSIEEFLALAAKADVIIVGRPSAPYPGSL